MLDTNQTANLRKISRAYFTNEYLQLGSLNKGDIYIETTQPVLFLKKDALITDEIIDNFNSCMEKGLGIYVPEDYYEQIYAEKVDASGKGDVIEKLIGLDAVRNDVKDTIDQMIASGKIDQKRTEAITDTLMTKVNTVDVSLLFQCLHNLKSVDEYLYKHSTNVAIINGLIGKWLRLEVDEMANLIMCGLLHDLGKSKIPTHILHAPRKLTEAEFQIIKTHPLHSYTFIKDLPNISKTVAEGVLYHHESVNGDGYPRGLTIEQIPLFARITAVSDVYDAMVSERCYKESNTPFSVLGEMDDSKYSKLDMTLVRLFVENMALEVVGKKVRLSDGRRGLVHFVLNTDYRHPIINVEGQIIQTNKELFVIELLA